MNQLIDAFKGVFTTAANSAGELAETANFVLKNVNWMEQLNQPEPQSNSIVNRTNRIAFEVNLETVLNLMNN